MKLFILFSLMISSITAFSGPRIDKQIICSGVGEMKGTFFDKKKDTVFNFNDPKVRRDNYNYEPGDGTVPYILGHSVVIGSKKYLHAPSVSDCKSINRTEIKCQGAGVGNGPHLEIIINKKTGIGSGSYFNPDARRGMNYSDDYNTYRYDRVVCKL